MATPASKELAVRVILGDRDRIFWGLRIIRATKRGGFSDDDVEKVMCWPTCGCGQMHARKSFKMRPEAPGPYWGTPTDKRLRALGCRFCAAVVSDDIQRAAELLIQIEARGTELNKGS